MADVEADKKQGDATQQQDLTEGKVPEFDRLEDTDAERKTGSLHEDPQKPTSDEDAELSDPPVNAARSQNDDDSVKIRIDSAEMDTVDLKEPEPPKEPETPKTKQPKSGRFPKAFKKPKKSKSINYEDRDPENLQEAVKVNFPDIIAEPSGAHSFNTIWGSSYKVYSVTKFWLYRILTLICGIPCSLFWGIYFACLAFVGIWCVTPCIRAISIKMSFLSKLWSVFIRTCFDPIFESLGLILSRIKIMLTLRRD